MDSLLSAISNLNPLGCLLLLVFPSSLLLLALCGYIYCFCWFILLYTVLLFILNCLYLFISFILLWIQILGLLAFEYVSGWYSCVHLLELTLTPGSVSPLQTEILDDDKRLISAVDYYFIQEDGSRFKVIWFSAAKMQFVLMHYRWLCHTIDYSTVPHVYSCFNLVHTGSPPLQALFLPSHQKGEWKSPDRPLW